MSDTDFYGFFYHEAHEGHEVFSAKYAQKKMLLENKFSRHFFFAYGRKKECGCPYGPAEKYKAKLKNVIRCGLQLLPLQSWSQIL